MYALQGFSKVAQQLVHWKEFIKAFPCNSLLIKIKQVALFRSEGSPWKQGPAEGEADLRASCPRSAQGEASLWRQPASLPTWEPSQSPRTTSFHVCVCTSTPHTNSSAFVMYKCSSKRALWEIELKDVYFGSLPNWNSCIDFPLLSFSMNLE